MNGKVR